MEKNLRISEVDRLPLSDHRITEVDDRTPKQINHSLFLSNIFFFLSFIALRYVLSIWLFALWRSSHSRVGVVHKNLNYYYSIFDINASELRSPNSVGCCRSSRASEELT